MKDFPATKLGGVAIKAALERAGVSPDQVQAKIEGAFKREAEIDARHISVAVSDHTARLYGHVHSLNEANAARAAAASAPGIASVESHLVVTP